MVLLKKLKLDNPKISFKADSYFCWSPKTNEVVYDKKNLNKKEAVWSLLHEVGHAKLGHTNYQSDIELIKMEAAAWEKAKKIAIKYQIVIDEDHIQDCIDTYRDWLHQRSACPACSMQSLQQDSKNYRCHNCGQNWSVTPYHFCRPYRLTKNAQQTNTNNNVQQTTFI
jgi:hypothetical protein